MDKHGIRKAVRDGYARIAKSGGSCCSSRCSCGPQGDAAERISRNVGYTDEDLKTVPEGANLGLGCGNPVALASLKPGEIVLDLGSGAGFDCFLAAARVGKSGRVIGVDMTPDMLEKARENARKGGYTNVEFRLGEIEHLPLPDAAVDAVISNCVINLSPDKEQVFREAWRVLKPGGRLMVSDITLEKPLPDVIRDSIEAYVGCLAGAVLKKDYLGFIESAGFKDVAVVNQAYFPVDELAHDLTAKPVSDKLKDHPQRIRDVAQAVVSIKVSAYKPSR